MSSAARALSGARLTCGVRSIHHPSEKLSKSSAVHAVIVSAQATMHESPNVPDFDPAETILLFPSADAVDVAAYPRLRNVKRVVVVDSQWQRTNGIMAHPNLQKLPCVVINKVCARRGSVCFISRGVTAQHILLALSA